MQTRRFALIGILFLAASAARAEDVPVFVAGQERGRVYVYKVGEQRYLNAKQAAEAYGGRFSWQPVSGKIQLSVRGRQAQLMVDSKRARVGDKSLELPEAVMVRSNTVLVPLEFFASVAFSKMTWTKTKLNAEAGRLELEPKPSVGSLRWFSHKGYTRVVLELDSQLTYSLSRRGRTSLDATIPLGVIDGAQKLDLNDGVVAFVRLAQEAKLARLSIDLAETAPKAAWDARVFGGPQRLVIDIYPDDEAMRRARAARGLAPDVVRGDAPPAEQAPEPDEPAAEPAPAEATPARMAAVITAPVPAPEPVTAIRERLSIPTAIKPSIPAEGAVMRSKRRIVIDPGHGGHDSGATGRRGVKEKNVNLAAARELAKLLREAGTFEVMLTRETDTFVALSERSRMANEFEADLFVSLHCNANRRRSENGFEIYFLSERASDPEAERVAEMENASLALEGDTGQVGDAEAALLLHAMARTEFINEASIAAGVLSKALAKRVPLVDRGVKQAAFYVLRGTSAPAVLVEMGFVSNPSEEAKLDSKKFRSKLMEGVYAGIQDFARRRQWASANEGRR